MRQLTNTEALANGIQLRPVITIIEDPNGILQDGTDAYDAGLNGGKRPPTSWMARVAGKANGRLTRTAAGEVPLYEGRACCFAHLRAFEGRSDLPFPWETTCPECRRRFRVTLGVVGGR